MLWICKYKNCRHESMADSDYCKHHKRMVAIEKKGPSWLNQMIEKLRVERHGIKLKINKKTAEK